MKLTASREALLKPLQAVIGVVERRRPMTILATVLLIARDGHVAITAKNLVVELVATSEDEFETDKDGLLTGRQMTHI